MTAATLLIVEGDSILAAHVEDTITALGLSNLRPRGHGGSGHHQGFPDRNHPGLTVERTRAGLEIARQLGRKGGRTRKMTDSKIELAKKLLANGLPPRDVAKNLGVSVPTLYRRIPASTRP
jgi:hypothetical protein